MEKKKFWNDHFFGYALKNILIAIAIIVGISWGVFILIDIYTNHGKTESVPNLTGLTLEEAKLILDNHHLKYEIIDSVYTKDKKLGAIVEQNPLPQTIVKPGREIYLIVNSKRVRQVVVPPVVDVSLRQAEAMLSSVGINVSGVSYAPSDYKDLILGISYQGKSLQSGARIPEGSYVTLIAGNGTGGDKSIVPSLKGLNLDAALDTLNNAAYTVGGIIYDEEPAGNEDKYVVYKQRPMSGEQVSIGSKIDIWLSKDKNKKDDEAIIKTQEATGKTKQEDKDIEDFF